jgi:hypothetical protein
LDTSFLSPETLHLGTARYLSFFNVVTLKTLT